MKLISVGLNYFGGHDHLVRVASVPGACFGDFLMNFRIYATPCRRGYKYASEFLPNLNLQQVLSFNVLSLSLLHPAGPGVLPLTIYHYDIRSCRPTG